MIIKKGKKLGKKKNEQTKRSKERSPWYGKGPARNSSGRHHTTDSNRVKSRSTKLMVGLKSKYSKDGEKEYLYHDRWRQVQYTSVVPCYHDFIFLCSLLYADLESMVVPKGYFAQIPCNIYYSMRFGGYQFNKTI